MVQIYIFNYDINFIPQVYHNNALYYYLDAADTSKANWMRYVNPAPSRQRQNLVACQVKFDVFFYTTRAIPPNTELLVWYSTEYMGRLRDSTREYIRRLKIFDSDVKCKIYALYLHA